LDYYGFPELLAIAVAEWHGIPCREVNETSHLIEGCLRTTFSSANAGMRHGRRTSVALYSVMPKKLSSWKIIRIRSNRAELVGVVTAADEKSAIKVAIKDYRITAKAEASAEAPGGAAGQVMLPNLRTVVLFENHIRA
jgi:hypothetical protein